MIFPIIPPIFPYLGNMRGGGAPCCPHCGKVLPKEKASFFDSDLWIVGSISLMAVLIAVTTITAMNWIGSSNMTLVQTIAAEWRWLAALLRRVV